MEQRIISLKKKFSLKEAGYSATISGINGISLFSEHFNFESLRRMGIEVRAHTEKENLKITDGVQWIIENIPAKRSFHTNLNNETTFESESPLDRNEFDCFTEAYQDIWWKTFGIR